MNDPADGVLHTARLGLEPMSVELMRLAVAGRWTAVDRLLGAPFPGEWRDDGWAWLQPRIVEGERDPALLGWGTRIARPRHGVRGASGPVIAEAGFHGPPGADHWVEIGYRVAVEYQRQGYAEEIARALITWALGQGVAGVRASVRPDNAPSLSLVRKLGFIEDGTFVHEHLGELLRFRMAAPSS